VAFLNDKSGTRAFTGRELDKVWRIAIEMVNNGDYSFRFKTIKLDTMSAPTITGVKKMDPLSLPIYVGPLTSDQTEYLFQVVKNLLHLSYSLSNSEVSRLTKNSIRLNAPDLIQAKAAVRFIQSLKVRSIGVIRSDDRDGDSYFAIVKSEAEKAGIVIKQSLRRDITDAALGLRAMDQLKDCPVILVFGAKPLFECVCEYAVLHGMNGRYYTYIFDTGSSISVREFEGPVSKLENWYTIVPGYDPVMVSKLKILYPDFNPHYNQYSLNLFDAVVVLARAINDLLNQGLSVSELNISIIREKIISNPPISGLTGPISFTETGERVSPLLVVTNVFGDSTQWRAIYNSTLDQIQGIHQDDSLLNPFRLYQDLVNYFS